MAGLHPGGDDHGGRHLIHDEPQPHTPAVIAEGLTKHYALGESQSLGLTLRRLTQGRGAATRTRFAALDGVSFSISRGANVGIVGTNGSGKSTLLQILAGTTVPSGGEMRVRGRVLPLLAVGSGFHPELTGRENVTLLGASLGVAITVIRQRMDAVTAFADLERHMDTPVKRFSSGMVARLSFAIATQFPADVYAFDEVLAVVDGEFQDRCLEEIRRLHATGSTVLFVSHNATQVEAICDEVLWLDRGRVERMGPTGEVLPAYERALHERGQA